MATRNVRSGDMNLFYPLLDVEIASAPAPRSTEDQEESTENRPNRQVQTLTHEPIDSKPDYWQRYKRNVPKMTVKPNTARVCACCTSRSDREVQDESTLGVWLEPHSNRERSLRRRNRRRVIPSGFWNRRSGTEVVYLDDSD